MKKIFQIAFFFLIGSQAFGQMILKVPGVTAEKACNPDSVYFLMTDKSHPAEKIDTLKARINKKISFAKENPTFKANVAIQCCVNCKGEMGGGLHIVDKSGNEALDKELLAFFKTVKKWNVGKFKGKAVDCWYMWRVEIANGYINITNR